MQTWVPVPGSVKARLVEAALYLFEQHGFDACSVAELTAKAGVTTGALYHHFDSKAGLYALVRGDLEKRVTDRMEGAHAAMAGSGQSVARLALLVGFDAAVRFDACRILGERHPGTKVADPIEATLRAMVPRAKDAAAAVLAAAWRAALLAVADGVPAARVRAGLAFALGD